MQTTPEILWPFFAMIALSFILMPITAFARFRAIQGGHLKRSQFKMMDLEGAPEFVIKTTRHWSNLYEVPVLFYALVLLALIQHWDDSSITTAAWLYVFCRYIHGFVHITYNNTLHRLAVFAISIICLLFIFAKLIARAMGA
jgi:hypothetical protein